MKFLIIFLILPIFCFSQVDSNSIFPIKDAKVVYESIVNLSDVNKKTIYAASKKWVADSFKSGKSVIQSEDESTGQIIGWGYGDIILDNKGLIIQSIRLKFSVQINCKDDRYRIRFYDIYHHTEATNYISETNLPIEYYSTILETKKSRDKKSSESDDVYGRPSSLRKAEKAKLIRTLTNKYFNGLKDNFNIAIQKYKNDDF
ncbi:DUF4468 domain-containing protein [Pedobacter frigiditerrae]|uniref:DUF4468 domain-containing protein n=1 Tax=Pedobacter frigiditerrae TaxID=2530452 RepID=UPI0029305E8C|nr:DUF4468 domain-containing protein [Pedobacter frigiditerrae]